MNNILGNVLAKLRKKSAWIMYRIARAYYRFCHCLPLNRNVVIFESEGDFCDNSWALYDYLRAKRKYRFVWVVEHVANFKDTDDTIFLTRLGSGRHWKLLYHYATARFSFFTHWTYRPYIPRKGQTVVNLWHGMPLKGARGKQGDYFDKLVSCNEEFAPVLIEFFGLDLETTKQKLLVTGYPRNDILLRNIAPGLSNPFCPAKVEKLILWMPTFRVSPDAYISEKKCDTNSGLPLLDSHEQIVEFNGFLRARNVAVLVKIHHLQTTKQIFNESFSNMIFLTDDVIQKSGLQLYQIIGKTDALLTDYSSITFDYLLIGKPQGFILSDFNEYSKSRGFLLESNDAVRNLLIGNYIYNIDDLKQFVEQVIVGKDPYREKRKSQIHRFHVSDKPEFCQRLCKELGL